MSATLLKTITLEIDECPTCGTTHAIPKEMHDYKAKYGGRWYCPNGHHIGWDKRNCQSEADKREAEIARLKSQVNYKNEQIETERKRVAAAKGEVTKIKNRVANGVCPCCKRLFQNLKRHMASKHPELKEV